MITPGQMITSLMAIADRAIEFQSAEADRKASRLKLTDAYVDWKDRNCFERVEKDTLEWVRMMAATKVQYADFEKAKRLERNARRRLSTAISRYMGGGA